MLAGSGQLESQFFGTYSGYEDDFADVRGQEMAKRAITIASAGRHNLLMLWPIRPLAAIARCRGPLSA